MAVAKTKTVKSAASSEAAAPKTVNPKAAVKVKNICKRILNTSKGQIKPGEKGEATAAELKSWSKYLEKA